MLKESKLLGTLMLLLACSLPAWAGPDVQWNIGLESTGADATWNSTTNVRTGYANYYYDCVATQVEVLLDLPDPQSDVWVDYSPAYSPDSAGVSKGVAAEVVEADYSSDELSFDLSISIDADGYAAASLSNVVFIAPWMDNDIIGLRIGGTLRTRAVQKIWGDDFESYTAAQNIGTTDDWMTPGWEEAVNNIRRCEVGSQSGKAWMYDGYYGGYLDDWQYKLKPVIADTDAATEFNGSQTADYVVRVTASRRTQVAGNDANFYILARANSTDHIYLEVGDDGYTTSVALMADTQGSGLFLGDDPNDGMAVFPFAEEDGGKPVYLTLAVEDNHVTGIAEHNGGKIVLRYDTTITSGKTRFWSGMALGSIWTLCTITLKYSLWMHWNRRRAVMTARYT